MRAGYSVVFSLFVMEFVLILIGMPISYSVFVFFLDLVSVPTTRFPPVPAMTIYDMSLGSMLFVMPECPVTDTGVSVAVMTFPVDIV